jgi:hypothetical protein
VKHHDLLAQAKANTGAMLFGTEERNEDLIK